MQERLKEMKLRLKSAACGVAQLVQMVFVCRRASVCGMFDLRFSSFLTVQNMGDMAIPRHAIIIPYVNIYTVVSSREFSAASKARR